MGFELTATFRGAEICTQILGFKNVFSSKKLLVIQKNRKIRIIFPFLPTLTFVFFQLTSYLASYLFNDSTVVTPLIKTHLCQPIIIITWRYSPT